MAIRTCPRCSGVPEMRPPNGELVCPSCGPLDRELAPEKDRFPQQVQTAGPINPGWMHLDHGPRPVLGTEPPSVATAPEPSRAKRK